MFRGSGRKRTRAGCNWSPVRRVRTRPSWPSPAWVTGLPELGLRGNVWTLMLFGLMDECECAAICARDRGVSPIPGAPGHSTAWHKIVLFSHHLCFGCFLSYLGMLCSIHWEGMVVVANYFSFFLTCFEVSVVRSFGFDPSQLFRLVPSIFGFCSVPSQFLCDSICTLQMVWCGVDSLNVQWSTSQTLAPLQCELQPLECGARPTRPHHQRAPQFPVRANASHACVASTLPAIRALARVGVREDCEVARLRQRSWWDALVALENCVFAVSTPPPKSDTTVITNFRFWTRHAELPLPELHCSARFHKVRKELLGKLFRARK